MNKYDKCIELWDDIFSKEESVLPGSLTLDFFTF